MECKVKESQKKDRQLKRGVSLVGGMVKSWIKSYFLVNYN